jgi:hypothetical protein
MAATPAVISLTYAYFCPGVALGSVRFTNGGLLRSQEATTSPECLDFDACSYFGLYRAATFDSLAFISHQL